MEQKRRIAEAARIRMKRYRERMSQEQREDILDRRRQSRHEEAEAVTHRVIILLERACLHNRIG